LRRILRRRPMAPRPVFAGDGPDAGPSGKIASDAFGLLEGRGRAKENNPTCGVNNL
jgi:hypothetical protein